jgi:hypothetical protein
MALIDAHKVANYRSTLLHALPVRGSVFGIGTRYLRLRNSSTADTRETTGFLNVVEL